MMSEPKEIFVKLDQCMGCHTCELACAVAHSESKTLYGALLERSVPQKRIYVEWAPPNRPVPILCRHCEEAPCLHACISGAIFRSAEGVVRSDPDRCIGCWTCVMVCPYGVIGRHLQEQKAYKCDRCPDLKMPACVTACPTKALVYRSAATHAKEIRQTAAFKITAGSGA
ncbi:MAG: 4Fe-4S dicluster domain-containing protein [Desulfobacterales bacterium]|nr:4Fe-4S dicluster domain-containing protein [Desulfobacterales bacterium]